MAFVYVQKAAPPRRRSPKQRDDDYKILHRIADKMAPLFEKKMLSAFDKVRGLTHVREILSAYASKDKARIEAAIPWARLLEDDKELRMDLEAIIKEAGVPSSRKLRSLLERTGRTDASARLGFDLRSPRIEKWAKTRSAYLIKEVTSQSRQAVRDVITSMLEQGKDPSYASKTIRDAVGLTRMQASAVERYRDFLTERGTMKPETIDKRVEAYRRRTLKKRAETISRTETIAAATQGQLEAWDQAARDGLIDKGDARIEWLVTPDDRLCPICAGLDGKQVKMGETFLDGIKGPPAHPNCRCATQLVL